MALSASREVVEQEGKLTAMPVAAGAKIFKGALVKVNAAGFLVPASVEAGSNFAGIAYEDCDNTGLAAGALECRVIRVGTFLLTIVGATQANVGDTVYASADDLVTVTSAANLQKVGVIDRFVSATQVWVTIQSMSGLGV